MKLLCPTCQKPLEVPEQYAGQMMKCPLCANTFTVPVLAQMPAAPPPAPPKQDGPAPKQVKHQAAPSMAPQPSGETRGRGFSIDPRLVPWLAPLSLVGIFVMLFLPWDGLFPGGVGVVTQNGWQTAFGMVDVDTKWAEYSTDTRAQYWKDYYGTDIEPIRKPDFSIWLIFFVVIIVPTTLAALVFLALHLKILPIDLPAGLAPFWPVRSLVVGGLSLAGLLFLVIALLSGFPLEQKIARQVETTVKDKRDAADPAQKNDAARWEIEKGIRLGGFVFQTTFWFILTVILNFVAVIGAFLEFLVERRGPHALPRLEFMG